MLVACKSLNTRAEIHDFTCQLDSLETSLDAISLIAAQGNRLLEVILIDKDTITPLPLEAFDGQLLSKPIQQLEDQWKRLLSEPVNYRLRLQDLSYRRIQRHYTNIIKFEQAVKLAEERLQRVEKSISRAAHRLLMFRQLEMTLERCQHNLAVEQASLQKYTERFYSVGF